MQAMRSSPKRESGKTFGVTDLPLGVADRDSLGIDAYYKGLATFVKGCATPITIAIQGDWGSGKTSAMQLVLGELNSDDRIATLEFNTWQYSQFDLGEQLPLILLGSIARGLVGNDAGMKHAKVLTFTIGKILARAGGKFVGSFVGVDGAEVVDAAFQELAKEKTLIDVITELRESFEDSVDEYLDRRGKERLVIFVDDLDRLEPRRAVEVMECLKLFLECPKCVFILAIDFDVVVSGVTEKYRGTGESMTLAKARSFFDKIIQVPFRMPVHEFQVGDLILSTLRSFGISADDPADNYVEAVRYSVGSNPRTLKRLLNTFNLLTIIKRETGVEPVRHYILFILLCAQAGYPTFHEAIASSPEELFEWNSEGGAELPESWGDPSVELDALRTFASMVCEAAGDVETLKQALNLSSITATVLNDRKGPRKGATTPDERRLLLEAKLGEEMASIGVQLDATVTGTLGERVSIWSQGANPLEWTIQRRLPDGSKPSGQSRLGLIVFRKTKGVTVYLGLKEYGESISAECGRFAQERLRDLGVASDVSKAFFEWSGGNGKRIPAVRGIQTEEDIRAVVDVLHFAWEQQIKHLDGIDL